MTTVTPAEMLRITDAYKKNLRKASKASVAVGLPVETASGKVYGDGTTVLRIGAIHEYGLGHNPRRSFLNVPFQTKKDVIERIIAQQFEEVLETGKDYKQALGIIGLAAVEIVKGAFTTRGYGVWPDIKQSTKNTKGSSQVLVDTGILKGSITSVVRD
jgi:hypothetical protein